MTEEKNLETLSTEILETEEREAERFSSSLYERLASQTDMTEEEQTALAAEVEAEVKVLENTSSQLKKAQKWAFDQADELRTRLKEGKTSDSRELLIRRAPANSVIDYAKMEHDHEHLEGEQARDPFCITHPDTDWRSCIAHAEKIGLGTSKYELIEVK